MPVAHPIGEHQKILPDISGVVKGQKSHQVENTGSLCIILVTPDKSKSFPK